MAARGAGLAEVVLADVCEIGEVNLGTRSHPLDGVFDALRSHAVTIATVISEVNITDDISACDTGSQPRWHTAMPTTRTLNGGDPVEETLGLRSMIRIVKSFVEPFGGQHAEPFHISAALWQAIGFTTTCSGSAN